MRPTGEWFHNHTNMENFTAHLQDLPYSRDTMVRVTQHTGRPNQMPLHDLRELSDDVIAAYIDQCGSTLSNVEESKVEEVIEYLKHTPTITNGQRIKRMMAVNAIAEVGAKPLTSRYESAEVAQCKERLDALIVSMYHDASVSEIKQQTAEALLYILQLREGAAYSEGIRRTISREISLLLQAITQRLKQKGEPRKTAVATQVTTYTQDETLNRGVQSVRSLTELAKLPAEKFSPPLEAYIENHRKSGNQNNGRDETLVGLYTDIAYALERAFN